jgi:hypothetical protein
MAAVMAISKFERLFRAAAGLDVDKEDLRRHTDFVNRKIYDLVLRGEANAKANERDIVQPWDLPITKGLQEQMHAFRRLDEPLDVKPILEELAALPPLDLGLAEETEARLPEIAGGVTVALARAFKILDPDVKNPESEHWDRAFEIFHLLL